MKTIKKLMMLAAVLLCGGAWAAEQLTWEANPLAVPNDTIVFRGITLEQLKTKQVSAIMGKGANTGDNIGSRKPAYGVVTSATTGDYKIQFQIVDGNYLKWCTVKFVEATDNDETVIKATQLYNGETGYSNNNWVDAVAGFGIWQASGSPTGYNSSSAYPITRLTIDEHEATISANSTWANLWDGQTLSDDAAVKVVVSESCTLTVAASDNLGRITFSIPSGKTLTIARSNSALLYSSIVNVIGGGTLKIPARTTDFFPSTCVYTDADSTIEINDTANNTSAVDGWLKGTGTVKFSGTAYHLITNGSVPAKTLTVELSNSKGLIIPNIDGTIAFGSLSGSNGFRTDYGQGTSRCLSVTQSKNTTWSGNFLQDSTADRLNTFTVLGTIGAENKTLTLSGDYTGVTNPLIVDSTGSVNLTGSWKGNVTINGEFGGSGSVTGATTITVAAGAKIRADWSGNNGPVTVNVAPTMGASIDVVCESIPDTKKIKLFSGTITASSTTTLARVVTTEGDVYDAVVSIESDGVYASVDIPEDQAVARMGDTFYLTLKVAIENAVKTATEANPVTVTLLKATAENVTIPDYVSVETGFENKLTGTISGSGTIRIVGEGTSSTSRAVPGISGLTNSANWTGTLEIANWHNETTIIKPSDYGNENSTFVFNGFKGYIHYENAPYVFKAIEFKGDGFEGAGSYGAAPEISLKAETISGNGSIKTGISCNNSNVGTFKLIGTKSVNLTGALSATSRYRLVLTKDQSETLPTAAINTIVIGKDITIADAKKLTASNGLTGSGTVIYDAGNTNTAPTFTVANTWTGTVWLKNLRASNYNSNKNQALATPATLNNLGKANSVIKMTNCAGYVNDGNNDSTFPWILELDGDSAWENLSGWSARTRTYGGLKGDGVLGFFGMGVNSHCLEVERFTDAASFTGSINVGNDANPYYTGKRVIIGSDNLPTGDSGQILVSSDKTVTIANDKTWTASAMFVNGTIKGSGTIASALTFNDGSIIDLTDNEGEVLKVAANKAVTFNGRVKVKGAALNDKVLSLGTDATLSASPAIILVDAEGTETDGYSLAKADNGDVTIVAAETVATVDGVGYSSLTRAVSAAASGEVKTIVVSRNFTAYNETVPSGVIIDCNGHTLSGTLNLQSGAYILEGTGENKKAKIDGMATSFDITFNHKEDLNKSGQQNGTIDYAGVSGMNVRYDSAFTLVKPGENGPVALAQNEEVTKQTGAHLKHHPYVQGITEFYRNTDQLTFAVVGTMPKSTRTTFIHMGESRTANDGGYGLLIATGDEENEVIVSWNNGTKITEITRMTVPNATTERHVYIITKNDDRTADTSTFTVYLNGNKRKTIVQSPRFMIVGGLQVGSDFGGIIKDAYNAATTDEDRAKYFRQSTADDGGIINVIRAYNRIITQDEINAYSTEDEYPYHSPNGSSSRTFAEGAANWVEESSTPWSNLAKGATEATEAGSALDNASIEATLTGAATITINVAEAGVAYEAFEVKGSGSATFEKGTGSGVIRATDTATIGSAITIKPGSLDISGVPVTLLEDGRITFDYSAYDVSGIYVTTKIYLTGEMDQDDTKVSFTAPTTLPYHTAVMAYDTSLKQYILTITPNHENGSRVFFNAASTYFDGNLAGKVELENGTKTVAFPGDTIVLAEGKSLPAWVGKPICAAISVETDVTLGMGAKSDVDQSVITSALDGKTITITGGKTLTLNNADRSWSFGSVTMNGPGSVLVKGAVTATAIAGNATFKLAENATLTVGTTLTVGRVVSGVDKMAVVNEIVNEQTVYSLAYSSTAEDVVIDEMPESGITILPGAAISVTTPEGATEAYLGAIAAKVSVKYTDANGTTTDLKTRGYVSVSVADNGAVTVATTNDAKPDPVKIKMTMPKEGEGESAKDKVSFTITDPIPGLFYSIVSANDPAEFDRQDGTVEDSTGTQATGGESTTTSIDMPDAKVKYFRVRVKATK